MKLLYLFPITVVCLVTSSCSQRIREDRTSKPLVRKVTILGNSIVNHSPSASVGWTGSWGMAASVRDSDFVHILMKKIKGLNPVASIGFANIADFERNFETFDFSRLAHLRHPDILIIKLSENVDPTKTESFMKAYAKLIRYIGPSVKTNKIIVDGFWPNELNKGIKQYAEKENLPFVSIENLTALDAKNAAIGQFNNPHVAAHPSDQGMRNIAFRIWKVVSTSYLEKQ